MTEPTGGGEQGSAQQFVPKYVQVRESLRERISTTPVGKTLPTVSLLLQEFNVSQSTLDRAIQELRAEGLIDSRRGSGIFVTRQAKTYGIGLLTQSSIFRDQGFYGLLAEALHQQAVAHRMRLQHFCMQVSPSDTSSLAHLRDEVQARRIHGLISLGVGYDWITPLGVPFVNLGGGDPQQERPCLKPDYSAMVRMAVATLAAHGRRRIGLLGHARRVHNEQFYLKEQAVFAEAVRENGVETDPSWITTFDQDGPSHSWGYQEMLQLWATSKEKPDGLVCVDDQTTLGVLFAAERLAIHVPDALSIASHANSTNPAPDASRVQRIEFNIELMAEIFLRRLLVQLTGGTIPETPEIVTPRVVPMSPAALVP